MLLEPVIIEKNYILSKISQEQIFEYYLNTKVVYHRHIRNPLRNDTHPSASFAWFKEKLIFRDWAENVSYDCFDVVCKKHNVNFHESLSIIASDFGLNGSETAKVQIQNIVTDEETKRNSSIKRAKINVEIKPWTLRDAEYLKSYGITSTICKHYNVYSIRHVWVNDNLKYVYSKDCPAIGYYFGEDLDTGGGLWKIYTYDRDKSYGPRFVQNTTKINGLEQLPDNGPVLVITKSMKDVMVLFSFNIPAIAPQSETIPLDRDLIKDLKNRFPVIFSNFDFDLTGIKAANKLRKEHDIQPLMLTNGRFGSLNYGSKDISDYVQQNGRYNTEALIRHCIDYWEMKLCCKV
jgi:hypothetical protein